MAYGVLGGGKRLRPLLVYGSGHALGAPWERLDAPACAVEFLHAYSLIHDDLPAMDDDDLRRGKPTCHKAFGESTAILAGDALQTLAFEVLASAPVEPQTCVLMIRTLAQASGRTGMVGGQMEDIEAESRPLNLQALEAIHRKKTGALIQASVRLGALAAEASESQREGLDAFSRAIGLAFQIQDDVLDVIGDAALLGKRVGADAALEKATYPALVGLEGARRMVDDLYQEALGHLDDFGEGAAFLRWLARRMVERTH
ncbi:MAG: (2E,6E)-farnesyl diphosphate synthase [Gammaproteobacteria bacterium]|nr:MAG: (2E,6E)-farnesyl diphosphate synthase [Gammaproteobacteria bacterium]